MHAECPVSNNQLSDIQRFYSESLFRVFFLFFFYYYDTYKATEVYIFRVHIDIFSWQCNMFYNNYNHPWDSWTHGAFDSIIIIKLLFTYQYLFNICFIAEEHTNKAKLIEKRQFGATFEKHKVISKFLLVLFSHAHSPWKQNLFCICIQLFQTNCIVTVMLYLVQVSELITLISTF